MLRIGLCAGFLFGFLSVGQADTIYTSGTASFRFTLNTYAGSGTGIYAPAHIAAAWVTDNSNNLVQTVLNCTSASRKNRLVQWYAVTSSATNIKSVNGISSATLANYTSPTMTVTWDGKDSVGNIMADGTYKFWLDFTECNNDSTHSASLPANLKPEPYETFSFTKGTSSAVLDPTDIQYNGNATYPITNVEVAFTPLAVPEPSTLAYLAGGATVLAFGLRCRGTKAH